MKFVADLHIHSKYSRATSPKTDLEHLAESAKIKGIKVLGTGDFTHPVWFKEIQEKLVESEPGLFKLKDNDNGVRFILSSEISCIYKKNNRVRKIHILALAPGLKAVEKINAKLNTIGNLKSDGRPILGLDAKDLARIIFDASPDCMVIPCHIWTPWFSLFGSKSGFDKIEDCFEELTPQIFALETGLSCYDEQTEVLTESGWKKFQQISRQDNICTLNIETNEIDFQKPIEIFTYPYKGKMYQLKTKRVDLLVTPNHNLLVSGCDFRRPPRFFLKQADFLFNKSKLFKKNGIWTGNGVKFFTLPAVKMNHGSRYGSRLRNKKEKHFPMEQWLKFFGFWIAEGWTTQGGDGDYNVCVSNQGMEIIDEMRTILESFGYKAFWFEKNYTLRVRDYQLFSYLKQFGKCSDKFIPKDIKSLKKDYLQILLDYYIKGDGHIYGRNRKGLSATTTSVRLRDDLQEIALKIGISAYYKLHQKKGTLFPGGTYKDRIYKQNNDSWVVYFIRHNIHTVLPSTIKKFNYIESWIDYDGLVFCVSVSNKVVYVRRNGIPVWCGNSDPQMNWQLSALDRFSLVSNSDCHSPEKIGREANVFDTDLSYFAIKEALQQKDKDKFLFTIEFFPEEGKYHYDGHRVCNICFSPEQTKKHNGICPVCKKPLVVGVLNRVAELADKPYGFKPKNAIPYKSLVPLRELIGEVLGVGPSSKKVDIEYQKLIKNCGSELDILLEIPIEKLKEKTLADIAEAIDLMRQGKVQATPGYDGVYGKIKVLGELGKGSKITQPKLFDNDF